MAQRPFSARSRCSGGTPIAKGYSYSLILNIMLGSGRTDFVLEPPLYSHRFFSVEVRGRILWGWERADERGVLLQHWEQLFMDYVACFCDAGTHFDGPRFEE